MVRFKNFECTINVDGVALPEYTDPADAGGREGPVPTAIVYIQSEEGKAFSINFSTDDDVGLHPEANAVCWSPILDGNTIKPGWICRVPRDSNSINSNKYQDCYGNWVEQNFLFSKLDVTEDDREPKDNNDTSSLGEIAIRIRRYKITGSSYTVSGKNNERYKDVRAVTSLHEKQLKGRDISHSVGMSAPKRANHPPTYLPGHCVDKPMSPYAVINFRYRTERALKGLGLIPRTPLPSPSPEPETIDANSLPAEKMTVEQLLAEVHRLRATQPAKVKQEKVTVKKRERSASAGPSTPAPKKGKKKKQDMIDLTGES